jgi:hypothetical protein
MSVAEESGPFTREDLERTTEFVSDRWRAGADRDWSVPAGTLDWSCAHTGNHAIDAVLAPAFFLASRKQDGYPEWDWSVPTMGEATPPALFADALAAVGHVLSAVIAAAPPGTTAVIWRRPVPTARPAADFAARGALEMILHGHDVATGLDIEFEPPADLCQRLRDHTSTWIHWTAPGWSQPAVTDDPWGDLLRGAGRARAPRNTNTIG